LHLLYCDESNLEERNGDFFVYGGLVVDADAALSLTHAIEKIRRDAGIPSDVVLKFKPCPDQLNHQQFSALKQAVIEAAIAHGCIFFASMILHDIATSADDARRNSINTICYHFDRYLNRQRGHGLVLIDRFNDGQIDAHLREKFSAGLTWVDSSEQTRLERIVGYHYSAIGQSHIPSIIDIVLGSFRHAINAHTRKVEGALKSAAKLLSLLAPLFFRERGDAKVSELSLMFSPKTIDSNKFRAMYEALSVFLAANGIVPEQPITGERRHS
jgi:Protein of unknown function (DUF3800)